MLSGRGCRAVLVKNVTDSALIRAWRTHLTLLAVVVSAVGVVFYDTFADMVGVWNHSSTFNHCFLIPFIAFYLGLTKRTQLAATMPAVSWLGLAYMAVNVLVWLGGELMSVAFAMHLAVVGMLIGAAWALIGNRALYVAAFPFFYLYFAVPEGEFLVPYLQDWTAMVVVNLLHLTGIPVFLEGRYLTIPSGSFVVAEACSGVNYLIATVSVGAMFMYLQFRATWRRLLFMVAAVAVPLLANGVRAYGIVMISHLSNYKYAQGVDHFIYGWVFFGFVIFLLFWIGNQFSDIDDATPSVLGPSSGAGVSVAKLVFTALLATGLVLAPRGALRVLDFSRPLAAEVRLPVVAGWDGPQAVDSVLRPNFRGADQVLCARYTRADGRSVTLDIVYFAIQGSGGELINHTNHIFDTERQRQVDYGQRALRAGGAVKDVEVLQLRDLVEGGESLYWYWYDSHGQRTANRPSIKLADGLARLVGRNEGGALMAISTPIHDGVSAVDVLDAFLASDALQLELLHPVR